MNVAAKDKACAFVTVVESAAQSLVVLRPLSRMDCARRMVVVFVAKLKTAQRARKEVDFAVHTVVASDVNVKVVTRVLNVEVSVPAMVEADSVSILTARRTTVVVATVLNMVVVSDATSRDAPNLPARKGSAHTTQILRRRSL